MTKQQAQWAESHDWWVATYNQGTKENPDYVVVGFDDDYPNNEKQFSDFEELKAWAGY